VRAAALATIISLATLGGASAQQAEPERPGTARFRSEASLVALNVTVTDAERRLVSGLSPADFAVYEDGVRQELRFFDAATVPIDLILLIDTSASMGGNMKVVHEAASGFLRTLRPGDRGALVVFDSRVRVLHGLSEDLGALEQAVRRTTAGGGTALNNALYIALKEFGSPARGTGEIRRQALVVLTDGDDTASLVSFEDVLETARRTGVAIYTIGIQSEYSTAQRSSVMGRNYYSSSSFTLNRLARESGAQAFFPTGIADLRGIYGTIAAELSNQYSLAYAPENQRQDGSFRRIVVQLPSRPELRPRARHGYLADAATLSTSRNLPNRSGKEP